MTFLLALSPLIVLLLSLMVFKRPASSSSSLAFLVALLAAGLFFGLQPQYMALVVAKGMSLALYVLLIIWSAIFLYQLVREFGALDVIQKNVVLFIEDRFIQFLLLSWLFASLLQGIAGFGVPVIIVVPILILLGFDPLKSAAAVLIGHSWSVSFGSMGSSFFTITLVTGLDQQAIGFAMAFFDFFAMLGTGLLVCYFYSGAPALRRGVKYVLPVSLCMFAVAFAAVKLNLVSLVGLLSALSGTLLLFFLYKAGRRKPFPAALYAGDMHLGQALFPYALIIGLSLLFAVLPLGKFGFAFRFPGFTTKLGHVVGAEEAYSKIKLFGHPAPILLFSAFAAALLYRRKGLWSAERFRKVVDNTLKGSVPTTITLFYLVPLAMLMMDSGMTAALAGTVAKVSGRLYPLAAPLFGVLGSFITGSNTNSNVLFGKFQISVAQTIGASMTALAGLQSIAGSVGVSLGPTTLLMAAQASGHSGKESDLYRKVFVPVMLLAALLGIVSQVLFLIGGAGL